MARVLLAKARRFGYGQEEIVPPLGVMYVASVLREAGHEVRIYDCGSHWNDPERFRRALLAWRPDVVGLSAITYEGQVMEGMARVSKATFPDVPVIAGGSHPSAYPERCARLGAIDYVVLGEGERTAVELVAALTGGGGDPAKIPGLAFLDVRAGEVVYTPDREAIEDLDAIPMPAWDLIDLPLYYRSDTFSGMGWRPYMTLFTSRGCPFKCIYCHEVQGKRFRARSPESIIQEIEALHSRYGIDDFEIIDDIFNFDRDRMLETMDRVIALKWRPKLHFPNALRTDMLDAAQIDRLYRAGTVSLNIAVETTSNRLQKLTKKYLNVEKVSANIDIAEARGLYVAGFFMLGFPTETYAEAQHTVDFALKSKLHHANFNIVTPFAGTALYDLYQELLRKRGLVGEDIYAQSYQRGALNMSEMTDDELFSVQQRGYRGFLLDPRRMWRILMRHQGRSRLASRALLTAYYSLPLGRKKRDKAVEFAWGQAGINPDPVVAASQREHRIEPARRAAVTREANRVRLKLAVERATPPTQP